MTKSFIKDPQTQLNGKKNVWIVKPNCKFFIYLVLSRGRGIKCFTNLN